MTGAAVVFAPMWGVLDDKANGLGTRLASGVAAFSCALLWICAKWGPSGEFAVIAGLALFGASSGGIEPLISAHIQRLQLIGKYPSLRLFGTGGWVLGLAAASLAVITGTLEAVYLLAGLLFGYLLIASSSGHMTVPERGKTQWRLPRPVVLFVLIGLPIPISAYVYLVFSAAAFQSLGLSNAGAPFITLLLMAALEVPAFLLVQKIIPGHGLLPLYALAMACLALSWLALMAADGNILLQAAALATHAVSAALWASLQVNVVRHYSKAGLAGFSQASASAMAKCLSATFAGVGAGWLVGAHNAMAAAWFILILCLLSLLCLLAIFRFSGPMASTKVPRNELIPIER
ncbi:hypothetical protein [Arthrobacter sp. UYCu712]|uniref:hypothetical protein n=1 Tax=Arthrobacter sp. UYCu712 TaxID=3156340 RepID=UPI003390AFA0